MADQLTPQEIEIIKQGAADRYAQHNVSHQDAEVLFGRKLQKIAAEQAPKRTIKAAALAARVQKAIAGKRASAKPAKAQKLAAAIKASIKA